jgi:hypothetical protein
VIHAQENRKNARFTCGAQATIEGPRGLVRGQCRDISVGGFFFVGGALPIGRTFEARLYLPNGTVAATGEVRYHHHYPEGLGMGLKFTRVSGDDLSRITQFIGG